MRERERDVYFILSLKHPLKRLYQYRASSRISSNIPVPWTLSVPLYFLCTLFSHPPGEVLLEVCYLDVQKGRGGACVNGMSEKGRWREWLEEEVCAITMDNIIITITPFMTINFNNFRNILLFGTPDYETTIYRIWNLNDAIN